MGFMQQDKPGTTHRACLNGAPPLPSSFPSPLPLSLAPSFLPILTPLPSNKPVVADTRKLSERSFQGWGYGEALPARS